MAAGPRHQNVGLMTRLPARMTAESQTERGDEFPVRIRRSVNRTTL